jgi:hypothetical protein
MATESNFGILERPAYAVTPLATVIELATGEAIF